MQMSFNANEAFEMAVEAERNGAQFYRKAADNAKDDGTRKILLKFAAMEDEHELIFKAIQKEFQDKGDDQTAFDPDGIAAGYIKAIADSKSWEGKAGPDEELTGDETIEEVIAIALQAEKEAVAFYAGVKELVSSVEDKGKVDAIIREEMSHVAMLSNMLNDLRG